MKSPLSLSSLILLFLLFTAAVAAIGYRVLDGAQGIAIAAGMGLVSLGAAAGLLRKPHPA